MNIVRSKYQNMIMRNMVSTERLQKEEFIDALIEIFPTIFSESESHYVPKLFVDASGVKEIKEIVEAGRGWTSIDCAFAKANYYHPPDGRRLPKLKEDAILERVATSLVLTEGDLFFFELENKYYLIRVSKISGNQCVTNYFMWGKRNNTWRDKRVQKHTLSWGGRRIGSLERVLWNIGVELEAEKIGFFHLVNDYDISENVWWYPVRKNVKNCTLNYGWAGWGSN